MARRQLERPAARLALLTRPPHRPGLVSRGPRLRARRPHGALDARLRRQQLSLHRRARRLRSQPGLQGLRGGRAAHHRPRARAPDRRAAGRDVALREGGVHHDRGQALLRAPRDRLVPGLRRHQEQHLQVPCGRGVLDHHDAAGAESLARGHQRAGQDAAAEAARGSGRAGDRGQVPQGQDSRALPQPDRSRATARTGSRRPPSGTSASRCATSTSPRPPPSPPSRRRRPATILAGIPT